MAKVTQLVCDKCGASDDVTEYTVTSKAGRVRIDLCPKHAKPLLDLTAQAAPAGRRKRKVYELDDDGKPVF